MKNCKFDDPNNPQISWFFWIKTCKKRDLSVFCNYLTEKRKEIRAFVTVDKKIFFGI